MTDKETADIEAGATRPTNFIRQIIENDLEQGNNLPRYWCCMMRWVNLLTLCW